MNPLALLIVVLSVNASIILVSYIKYWRANKRVKDHTTNKMAHSEDEF